MSAESFPSLPATPTAVSETDISSQYQTQDHTPPPVLISPVKQQAHMAALDINKLSYLDVWYKTDTEIIGELIYLNC